MASGSSCASTSTSPSRTAWSRATSACKESLPTIKYLRDKGAKVILMSHLGRPDGKRVPDMSLAPVAKALAAPAGHRGEVRRATASASRPSRPWPRWPPRRACCCSRTCAFTPRRRTTTPRFAKQLAALADVYVNDAFGTAHRAHASTDGITQLLPQAAAGYLMKKELDYLGEALGNPARPFVAIIGGSKVSGKIDVIKNLLPRVDQLLIGGGMTYTFLKAQGLEVGKSIVENDKVDLARSLLAEAGDKLVLADGLRGHRQAGLQGPHRRRDQDRRPGRDPRRLGGGRHRPRHRRRVHQDPARRQDHRLERPGGRVRDRRHRQGHHRRSPRRWPRPPRPAPPPSSAAATPPRP